MSAVAPSSSGASSSSAPLTRDLRFTVRTKLNVNLRFEFFDIDEKIKTLASDFFDQSTTIWVTGVPASAKRLEIFIGNYLVNEWDLPFYGQIGLEVKTLSNVYSHDFEQRTVQNMILKF